MLRNTESKQKQSSTVWKLIAGLMAVMMVSGGFAGAVAAQEPTSEFTESSAYPHTDMEVVDGIAYYVDDDTNEIVAQDVDSGTVEWSTESTGMSARGIGVSESQVFVAGSPSTTDDDEMIIIDKQTGDITDTFGIDMSGAVPQGVVYEEGVTPNPIVVGSQGESFAIDTSSQSVDWTLQYSSGDFVTHDDNLVVFADDFASSVPTLVTIDPANGDVIDEKDVTPSTGDETAIGSAEITDDGVVYASIESYSTPGMLVADYHTGDVLDEQNVDDANDEFKIKDEKNDIIYTSTVTEDTENIDIVLFDSANEQVEEVERITTSLSEWSVGGLSGTDAVIASNGGMYTYDLESYFSVFDDGFDTTHTVNVENQNSLILTSGEDGNLVVTVDDEDGNEVVSYEEEVVDGDTVELINLEEVDESSEYTIESSLHIDVSTAYATQEVPREDDNVDAVFVEFAALDDGADPVESTVTVEAFNSETQSLEQVDESVITIDDAENTTVHEVDIGDEFTGEDYTEYVITVEDGGDVVTTDLTYAVLGGGGDDTGSVTDGIDNGLVGAISISVFAGLIAILIARRI